MTIAFGCAGKPAGKGSFRPITVKGKTRLINQSAKRAEPWRKVVEAAARTAMGNTGLELATGPVTCELAFTFPRCPAHYGTGRNAQVLKATAPTHPRATDGDKLARLVLDALTGIVWADDSQVVELRVSKAFGEGGMVATVRW
jgi:crossover junction endodeoxyribonuclease RusA